jgi:hypothetical protein
MSYVVICPRDKTVFAFDKEQRGCRAIAFGGCKPTGDRTPLCWNTREGAVNHIDHLIHLHGLRREDLAVGEWSAADGVKADSASMDNNQTEQVR